MLNVSVLSIYKTYHLIFIVWIMGKVKATTARKIYFWNLNIGSCKDPWNIYKVWKVRVKQVGLKENLSNSLQSAQKQTIGDS